ncbi:MAG: methylmalonyl-CoA mutase family protein, partial [Flavobacteriales bacterium]
MATERLFDAFPPATREQWEAVIKKELKDKELATLNVEVHDRVLPPFNMADEGRNAQGRRRGVKRDGNPWHATVAIDAAGSDANKLALEALMGGAEALELMGKPQDLRAVLKDIWVGAIDLAVDGDENVLDVLLQLHQEQNTPATAISICLGLPHDADVSDLKDRIAKHPRIRLFSVSDGASRNTQDALHQGRALLQRMLDQGYTIDDACARLQFRLHLDDDLFLEVARLRAFREAWAAVVAEFKPKHGCSHSTWVQAV